MTQLQDDVRRLQRELDGLKRQLAGLPVRLGDVRGGGGSESLGCYLHRVSGNLTINLDALFAEPYEIDDTEPCPKVVVGGVLPAAPGGNVEYHLTTTNNINQWTPPRKTLIMGDCITNTRHTAGSFEIENIQLIAGSGAVGPIGGPLPATMTIRNAYNFPHLQGQIVVAAKENFGADDWVEICPFTNGEWRAIVGATQISAATGNYGGPIFPGVGLATIYLPTNVTEGTPWTPSHVALVENWTHGAIPAYTPIGVRFIGGTNKLEAIFGGCKEVPHNP